MKSAQWAGQSVLPLVSIVTPTFNQAEFLERTIQSVLMQDYPRIEYIVVDGSSTDGTQEILARYADRLRIVSEPDKGQADAINKGFRLANGQIMGWLNSDDLYLSGAIAAIVRFFARHSEVDFVYGDAMAIDPDDHVYGIRAHVRQTDFADLTDSGDFIVQPAAFWRASLWREVGELDTTLQYVLDYDYWIRAAKNHSLLYVPVCLAAERLHTSAKTSRGWEARTEEIKSIVRRYELDRLPIGFRGQIAAEGAARGVRRLARFDRGGVDDLRAAKSIQPPFVVFLKYFLVILILGEHAVARFWLLANRRRQGHKVETVLPDEFLRDA